jgi:hypothetical protein
LLNKGKLKEDEIEDKFKRIEYYEEQLYYAKRS